MTIWERVKTALSGLGMPMAAVLMTGELPDAFLVYSLVNSSPKQHAGDVETMREYTVQVNGYDRAGADHLPDIHTAMIAAGFAAGDVVDLPYNQTTGHYGLALEFNYLEDTP
jgi:hypothetical protein